MVIGNKKEMVGFEGGCLRNKENLEEVEVAAKVCYFLRLYMYVWVINAMYI